MKKKSKRIPRRRQMYVVGGLLICCIAILGWRLYFHENQMELPYLTADSVAVLDTETGRFVYEKDADTPRSPASLTKLMTLLLVLDDLSEGNLHWEDTYAVTEQEAYATGSKYGMEPGEVFTVRQLVAGVAMSSGCDCVQCLVRLCAGDETVFIERMNQEAEALGLIGSHFANATGIDAIDHYMTAKDIAKLSQELLKRHPDVLEFTAGNELTVETRVFQNTNRLAGFDQRVLGLKTGTSQMGGYNLTICADSGGERYIIVLLGSNDDNSRYSEAEAILDALPGGQSS